MASTNLKTKKSHIYNKEVTLAGGSGLYAAKTTAEQSLRRLVLSCLLFEDIAYVDGLTVADQICELVPQVNPLIVANLAIEARYESKLRHVPLLLVREMARYNTSKSLVANTLAKICKRPDDMMEFLSLYWRTNNGKKSLSSQVKLGLAKAFCKFDEYQLAKYNRLDKKIKLRDVLFLSHAKPLNASQELLFKKLVNNELSTPETWEVGLSAAKNLEEKKSVWENLITHNKLPALALLKNIHNMESCGVDKSLILSAFHTCSSNMLLPIDFFRAYNNSQEWSREIEDLMFRCVATWPKLLGHTIFVVDVSGSMAAPISAKSQYSRLHVAASLAVLTSECCEHISIYTTAGNDSIKTIAIEKIKPLRGFALVEEINSSMMRLGNGGIFTRQCCDYLTKVEDSPNRLIIFSDSQDCDYPNSGLPKPHGKYNYIVDVSSHQYGIDYNGVWSASINGWSEFILKFIYEYEKVN